MMKSTFAKIIVLMGLMSVATTNVFAQPYTPTVAGDTYGIGQAAGTEGAPVADSNDPSVPTPKDNNDNLSGSPNPADINDAINLLLGTSYKRNADVDSFQVTGLDHTWLDISTTDTDGTFVLMSLTALNSNTLRVYDTNDVGTKIAITGLTGLSGFGFSGNGTAGDPFAAGLSPLAPGTNFGWSILSETPGADPDYVWDSNPAYNPDGLDHMLTYHLGALAGQKVWIQIGANPAFEYTFFDPYLIAWEDLPVIEGKLGDEDYDDLIFLVDRVQPIPEPMTMALFGSGLFGMAALRRKKQG